MSARPFVAAAKSAPETRLSVVGSDVTVRSLTRIEEFRACVALQEATWGQDGETVPVSLLVAATRVGGLALGAYDVRETLLGFVFGLAGTDAQGALHLSHMLAVRTDVRGSGIGRALKERQRAELARRGVNRIAWTFDPLQSRNAHLNINRLGARVVDYVDDMYGVTRSPLHLGMATDRLIVMIGPGAISAPVQAVSNADGLPILALSEQDGAPFAKPRQPPSSWKCLGKSRRLLHRMPRWPCAGATRRAVIFTSRWSTATQSADSSATAPRSGRTTTSLARPIPRRVEHRVPCSVPSQRS